MKEKEEVDAKKDKKDEKVKEEKKGRRMTSKRIN